MSVNVCHGDEKESSLLVEIVRFHSAEQAVVEEAHHETFCAVVKMLSQGQHVVSFLSCGSIKHSPLHTRAIGANGLAILRIPSTVHDVIG